MMQVRKLVHLHSSGSRLETDNIKAPTEDQVLLRSLYSLVSLGTERLVARGEVPERSHIDMRVPGMEGSFSFPCTYGYSLVGEVLEGPADKKGKRVHLLHPHVDHVITDASELAPVPEEIPGPRASLASNMETAVNALWDGRLSGGEKVLIVGFGLIGALIASLLKTQDTAELMVCDSDQAKRVLAENLGFEARSSQSLPADHYDIVFHAAASASGLQTAIDAAGFEGKIIETSWHGNREVCLDLGGSFHHLRKQIFSSQVSSIPGHMRQAWDHRKRKKWVWQLLLDPWYDQLITRTIAFEDTPEFFDELRKGNISELAVVIAY